MSLYRHRSILIGVIGILLGAASLRAGEVTAVWLDATSEWNDAAHWSTKPEFPNNDNSHAYVAVVGTGSVALNQDITVEEFLFGGDNFPTLQDNYRGSRNGGPYVLTAESLLTLNHGLIKGKATLNALAGATISGNVYLYGWRLNLAGNTTWSGRLGVGNASVIENREGAFLNLSSGAVCTYYQNELTNPIWYLRALNNYGTINASAGSDAATLDIALSNSGTVNVISGTLVLKGGGVETGAFNLTNNATLDFEETNVPVGASYTFAKSSSISGAGSVTFNAFYHTAFAGTYDVTGATTVRGPVTFSAPIANIGNSLVIDDQYASCDLGSNSITVNELRLRTGAISGTGTINVSGPFEWNQGSLVGGGTTNAQSGVFFNGLSSPLSFRLDQTLNLFGNSMVQTTAVYQGYLPFGLNAMLKIMPGASLNGSRLNISGSGSFGLTNGAVVNQGALIVDDPALNRGMSVFGTLFVNEGNIRITNSKLDLRSSGPQPAFLQTSGSTLLENGALACDRITITGGSLSGSGSVGALTSSGLLAPSGGVMNFFNNPLTLGAGSVLAYHLSGTQPGTGYGKIINVSTATLDGDLEISVDNGFRVSPSDTFTVLSAFSIPVAGQFTNVSSGGRLTTTDGSGSFRVTYTGNEIVLRDFLPANP